MAFSAFHCLSAEHRSACRQRKRRLRERQPVRRTKKMASIAARSGTRGLWQPSGCAGRAGSNRSIFAHNSSDKRQPSSRTRAFIITRPTRLNSESALHRDQNRACLLGSALSWSGASMRPTAANALTMLLGDRPLPTKH